MMATLCTSTRRYSWEAAHRVLAEGSRCASLHGHSYSAEVSCQAAVLGDSLRSVDWSVVDRSVGRWISERWDGATLVGGDDQQLLGWLVHHDQRHYPLFDEDGVGLAPTPETLATELLLCGRTMLQATPVQVISVVVHETVDSSAGVL